MITQSTPLLQTPWVYVLLCIIVFCICGVLNQKYRYWPVFLFLLFFMVGTWRTHARFDLPIHSPTQRTMVGRVVDTGGLTAAGNQRVAVVAEHAFHGNSYRLMVYVRPHLPRLEMGQIVRLEGEVLPLTRAVNPGGYDAFLHLRTQKMDGIMWVDRITIEGFQPNLFVHMRQIRDRIASVYDAVLPAQEAGIIRSMVLGDREDINRELVEIYRGAGIRHILSISGLHVTILTLLVNTVLGKFLHPRRAGLFTLIIMILYCLMTGAAIATVRAVFMGGVLIFSRLLYRDYDMIATISWACIVLLLYEPLMLYNVGFQLSFGAVYGIALLTAPFERLFSLMRMPAYGKFRNGLAVSCAATCATYIVFAFHFYEIPLYSVVANVIIIPFAMIALLLAVVTALIGLVWLELAVIPAGAIYYIFQLWEFVGRFFNAMPHALVQTGGGSLWVALAGVVVLLSFVYVMHGFEAQLKKRLPILLFAVTALLMCIYLRDFPIRPQTTVLYTQGAYVVTRHHNTVHITGNGRGGEQVLLQYLNRRNVRRACVLTLTEVPRAVDASRLVPVMARIEVLHISMPEHHLPDILRRAIYDNGVLIMIANPSSS